MRVTLLTYFLILNPFGHFFKVMIVEGDFLYVGFMVELRALNCGLTNPSEAMGLILMFD